MCAKTDRIPKVKIYFTWQQFDTAVEEIARRLKATPRLSRVKNIYGIPRGGLVLAVALSHKLNLPIALEDTDLPNLLVVDDISDSGETLREYRDLVTMTVTIHLAPTSSFVPDIWVYTKDDPNTWIVYPWEKETWERNN